MLRWTVHLKGAPNKGNNHSAVAVDDRIYYFGDPKRTTMKQQMGVYILNCASLRWTKLRAVRRRHAAEDVPSVRRGHTAVLVVGGDQHNVVYVYGGIPYCDAVHAFDVAAHRWRKPAVAGAVPEARQHHSACALGTVMYVFGGETVATRCTDDMYRLDTGHAPMCWSRVVVAGVGVGGGGDMGGVPALVSSYHSATVIGTRMFVFGGWGGRGVDYNNIRVFDTESDRWLSAEPAAAETGSSPRSLLPLPLPEGRLAPRAFAYEGELYIFGGWNCNQTLSDLWRFSPVSARWARVEPKGAVPRKPWMCCCAVGGRHGDRIVLFKDDLYILDMSPSLKTLCELAAVQHRLDQSGLPHNVLWELAAMRKTRARRRTRTQTSASDERVAAREAKSRRVGTE